MPALRPGSVDGALEQVGAGAHRLGDHEQVGVGGEPSGDRRVAPDLGVEQVGGVALTLEGELVVALHLGVGQGVAGPLDPPPVAVVDHVDLARGRRHDDHQVALAGLAGRRNRLDADVQWRVDPVGGDLLDALREAREVDRGQGWRGRLVALVDPDDERAPVDGELGEVPRQLLVRRRTGR